MGRCSCAVAKNFTVPSRDIAKNLTLCSTDGDFRHGDGIAILAERVGAR